MATIRDVITRSLRLIGVVAHDSPPSAEEIETGLEAFNAITARYGQSEDAALADEFSTTGFEAKSRDWLTHILAAELANEYGVLVPDFVATKAIEGDKHLLSACMQIYEMTTDPSLRSMPSRNWGLYRSRRF